MEIIVSSRNSDIKGGIKEHAQECAEKLKGIHSNLTSCRVILNIEKNEQSAEFIVHGKNIDMEAKASNRDNVYTAIDKAADKIEKQLRKFHDKVVSNH